MRSQVLFTRFQRETPTDGPIESRQLSYITEAMAWLTAEYVQIVTNPEGNVADPNSQNKRPLTNPRWWGRGCTTTESMTPGQLFDSPFQQHPHPTLFRSRVLRHDYQWDAQSMGARAIEVILERLDVLTDRPGFNEVVALLIDPAKTSEQRLVVPDEEGYWREPSPETEDPERRFHIAVLGELARSKDMLNDVAGVGVNADGDYVFTR